MDESTQARQNAFVCQAMSGELTFDSLLRHSLSAAPDTDDYMQVQREALSVFRASFMVIFGGF